MSKIADSGIDAQQAAYNTMTYGMENKHIRSRVDGVSIPKEKYTVIHPTLGVVSVQCILCDTHPEWLGYTGTHTLDVHDSENDIVLHTYTVVSGGLTIMGDDVCYHFNITNENGVVEVTRAGPALQPKRKNP